ncbi:Unknown protein [Striga hermonthica]|uniref:F-box domain-containing protein n=1 Tax=Striga hermonthica TaxID=68872 RepID=A0A9N7MKX7_STRHE|nr:Unknown protein [Striga hermonthica]
MVTDSEDGGIADSEKQAAVYAQNSLLFLPDDVLLKILLNLSAQDIYYTASRVCRRLYYHMIRSEEFVNLHLRQTEEYGLLFRFIYAPRVELINSDKHSSQRKVFVSMKQGRVTVSNYYYAYKSLFNSGRPHRGVQLSSTLVWRPRGQPRHGTSLPTPSSPRKRKLYAFLRGVVEASCNRPLGWVYPRPTSRTEGFIHLIYGDIVLTLNVVTEVMTETRAPGFPVYPPKYMKWYLSTGKALTVVAKVGDGVFRVWELVSGDYSNYWREWESQILLGSEFHDLFHIQPVGWLQQMEVLVFSVSSGVPMFSTWLLLPGKQDGSPPYQKGWLGNFIEFLVQFFLTKTPLCSWRGTIKPIYYHAHFLFMLSIFRRQSSSPPSSGDVEAEGIADGEKQAAVYSQINLLSLPDDLLWKILLNLSAQDIYRASLVCRSLYYHTIRSEEFVNLHLWQTDEYGLFFRFIYAPTRELIDNYRHYSRRIVFVSMKQGRVMVSDYYYPYKPNLMLETSCNGLIPDYIYYDTLSGVHLANPVMGRAFQLPPLPENAMSMKCCVGYAEASNAYKVALAYTVGIKRWDARRAILTVGVDKSWRHLATDHLTESSLSLLVVTEGFIHSIFGDTITTLNVETEVMTETWAPVPVYNHHKYKNCYLSTGKALTVVVQVEDGVFRVWEMVRGDSYYWRELERQIVLGSRRMREIREVCGCGDKDLVYISPVGWLQQMEVLVFVAKSKCRACEVFYVVIATGEIGWITPISSNKGGFVGEFYEILKPVLAHKNTLVQLEGYY